MKVLRAYDFLRNDCTMDLECEHCGHVDTDKSAYNDEYFRIRVVPDRHCHKCGKDSAGRTQIPADKIQTTEGDKTIPEIIDHLTWCSYKANRGYGCTHEGLVKIGIGTEAMRLRYEAEQKTDSHENRT